MCLAALPAEADGAHYRGGLEALIAFDDLPRLRPGVETHGFSSYDRTGGNNDGFGGTYSKLRAEDGNSVIAEMDGPGCIQRIWFTHSIDKRPGLLDLKGEHIRVYLNGDKTPVLDVPLEDLFDGSLEHFPTPLAGQGIGGFYAYVPIAYRESCKVVVEGDAVRFYQIDYVTFPDAEGVENFDPAVTAKERKQLDSAVELWTDPAARFSNRKVVSNSFEFKNHPKPEEPYPLTFELKAGKNEARIALGMTLEGIPDDVLREATIEIAVADPGVPPVRVPMDLFFGQAFQPGPFSALGFGKQGDVLYNWLPFVFEESCSIRIHSVASFEGKLRVYSRAIKGPLTGYGRLQVQVHESLPTQPEKLHPFLHAEGKGHYVGTFLATEGPKGLPYWLEGDDQWRINDELRIHGTGSEDYFNCGWYALPGRLNGPETLPTHGFPVYNETDHTMRATAFRWHLGDPKPFDGRIDVGIEHGGENAHYANYRSAAFYYLAIPEP